MKKSGLRKRSQRLRVWRRDKKRWQKHRPAEKLSHSEAYHWENHHSGQNPPFWSYSTFIICLWDGTRQASHTHPPPSLETTFSQIPGCWGEGLHTPLCLSCDYLPAISNLGQLKIPQRRKQREICTTTHLCRAKIGTNQMAPHWMLPSASGHPSKTPFFFHKLQWLNPKLRKVSFFPLDQSYFCSLL